MRSTLIVRNVLKTFGARRMYTNKRVDCRTVKVYAGQLRGDIQTIKTAIIRSLETRAGIKPLGFRTLSKPKQYRYLDSFIVYLPKDY